MFWYLLSVLLAHHSEELIKLYSVIQLVLTHISHHGQQVSLYRI